MNEVGSTEWDRLQYMLTEETSKPKLIRKDDESVFVRVGSNGDTEGKICMPIIDPEFQVEPKKDEGKVTT